MKAKHVFTWFLTLLLIITLFGTVPAAAAPDRIHPSQFKAPKGKFSKRCSVRCLACPPRSRLSKTCFPGSDPVKSKEIRPDRGPSAAGDTGFSGDGALQMQGTRAAQKSRGGGCSDFCAARQL